MPTTTAAPELKFTALDLKQVDPDGTFAGYASLFGTEDMGHDIVLPGAFRDSLARRGTRGIKMLFQHKPDEPIGVWETLKEDARGLYAKGRLMLDVARAREMLSLMRAGALDGLSIGFRAIKGRRDARTGVRRLEKVDLWEISVVTFPLLPEARVAHVKARPFAHRPPTEREFERWLTQDAGLSARRPGRSSAMASRASPRRTLLEATPRPAASSIGSKKRRGSCVGWVRAKPVTQHL
jgi:Escherichia/Staphylococcus phage prohead protease